MKELYKGKEKERFIQRIRKRKIYTKEKKKDVYKGKEKEILYLYK